MDHIAGLTYLPAIADETEITVWAPGQVLADADSRVILEQLVGGPYLSVGISDYAQVTELTTGENSLGPFSVDVRVQPLHPGGSVGFRVGDALAYCTDTAPDPDTATFARGVTSLVHEAWTAKEPTFEHSSATSAAQAAADADVGRLVLSHIHPLADDPAALLAAARSVFVATEVGHDGLDIS